jgi:hypothetical protein
VISSLAIAPRRIGPEPAGSLSVVRAENAQSAEPTAWSPLQEAERAVAAVHGLCCVLIPPDKRDPELVQATKAIRETVNAIRQDVRDMPEVELREYCADRVDQMRAWATEVLTASTSALLNPTDPDRIFRMFRDRWSTSAMSLRASVVDDLGCFSLPALGTLLGRTAAELGCLPPSSEFVLGLSPNGLHGDLEIPARAFALDAVLLLELARGCHDTIARWAAEDSDGTDPVRERVRHEAFTRQVLITGVTAVEAALFDYGQFVTAVAASRNPELDVTDATTGEITTRLSRFASAWPPAFGRPSQELPDPAADMLALVELRNRLVRHDAGPAAWQPAQLDMAWFAENYPLSVRAMSYQDNAADGLGDTHIGMEYAFAVFALDTALATIDAIHTTVYPEQASATWLRLPRTADGRLDPTEPVTR